MEVISNLRGRKLTNKNMIADLGKRFPSVIIIVIAIVFALLKYSHIPVGSFFDDAHYIVLAKSLYSGQGYRLISFPGAPIENAFPPGWPLLLGLFFQFAPFNLVVAKMPAFAFWAGSIFLARQIFADQLPPKYATIFLGLLALNPNLLGISGTVMSEPAYLFFSLVTIHLYKRWQAENRSIFHLLALIFLAIFTTAIRSIGISLLLAILLALVYQYRHIKRRYWLVLLGLLVSLISGLILFNQANGGFLIFSSLYSDHIFYISSNFVSFLKFWQYGAILPPNMIANAIVPIFDMDIFSTLFSSAIVQLFSLMMIVMILLGFFFSLKQAGITELYFIFYVAIFYFWSVYIQDIQPRIVIPLIPFMLFYFTRFILVATAQIKRIAANIRCELAAPILWSVLAISILFNLYSLQRPFNERVIDLSIGTSWLRENSAPDAIVMSTNPVPDYLYMQRRTVKYNRIDSIEIQLETKEVDYILIHPPLEQHGAEKAVDSFTENNILTYLKGNPTQFELLFHDQQASVWVFRVRPFQENNYPFVIPAKAGIHAFTGVDSCLRRNDSRGFG